MHARWKTVFACLLKKTQCSRGTNDGGGECASSSILFIAGQKLISMLSLEEKKTIAFKELLMTKSKKKMFYRENREKNNWMTLFHLFSRLTKETLEQSMKYVQSQQ